MDFLLICLTIIILINYCFCSAGDRSTYYQKCLENCSKLNCSEGGQNFINNFQQPLILYITWWSCIDECKYDCMWKTVEGFHERNWQTPQFYGKWPFIRCFGLQEPASVLFSVLNGYAHFKMIKRFRKDVRPDSPFYWLWHAFCIVSLHAWFWSAVFHARDFPLTELFDYACAFSMVLMSCYVMLIRLLKYKIPRFALLAITTFFFTFFANYVMYLSMGRIDYGYNMELNILIGTFTAICWFGWCTYNRIRQPYVWKCALFVALTGIVMLLEVIDKPPLFYVFDSHSLWHLTTAPLVILLYSFAIDDCKYLRKKEVENIANKKEP
ncbi:post-GPI attachment to proteins factor 3 [Anoplophora glabripennis]|uniref:post-GPI attachment to proteins factor 3 n=1 Tax=Anoplophora glabripennis TaxID=217634 RepID=UPI0008753026|nr:post-GPI attachment to proteins factor 3 [Anoplophora glabripennis]